ncbi:MAG: UbiA prenyltransferase family protein [Candidatus Shapirobacteria bacterium]|nr:UbiA prenyltransferase family protein [Candidatus Shapirobacteria bacterium]MDD4410784.1 UbiA prenyltransferase family protein [Candidatus Shapirobacteria bacterium]
MLRTVKLNSILEELRPIQWIKNLAIFAAIILNGQLFNKELFIKSIFAFITFCLLSSSSYIINDLLDVNKDRLHPVKKNRPIARGDIPEYLAAFIAIILLILGLTIALFTSYGFFIISLFFILLQYAYSLFLKKKAIIDIVGIALFFIIRAYAGEIVTGYHLPIWIMLAVIFLSLFIASGKRRSELVNSGIKTRSALAGYGKNLLNFYTTMFAVCTLITYAMFTFFEESVAFTGSGLLHRFLLENIPNALNRKWYMITLLPVIFGMMRYGQIIFEMQEGERPERIIATDIPLLISVLTWGLMIIGIVYAI